MNFFNPTEFSVFELLLFVLLLEKQLQKQQQWPSAMSGDEGKCLQQHGMMWLDLSDVREEHEETQDSYSKAAGSSSHKEVRGDSSAVDRRAMRTIGAEKEARVEMNTAAVERGQ